MGRNWEEYINEAIGVLGHCGQIIVAESVGRFVNVKQYLQEKGITIKEDYDNTKRLFYIYGIKC